MSKQHPFVSIVVVNYNGKGFMKDCLDSLAAMDYPKQRYEVTMVDNNSSDDSVGLIKSGYKRIKIIENEINSYCKACNLGIVKSRGEYVVLLNNDVRVTKSWLLELIKVVEGDSLVGAVTSKLLREDGTIQNAGHYELPNFYWDERGAGKQGNEYSFTSEVESVCGACVLYRKKALEQVGLLDEDFVMFSEDVDMSIRLKQRGWKLIYAPTSVAYHKFHGSCDDDFSRDAIERNRLLLIAKHYPHKLPGALVGSGYFIISRNNMKSGQLFDLMPKMFLKLIKYHNQYVVNEVLVEVFAELKRILNYENKKLEDELKNISVDLAGTKKIGQEEIQEKDRQFQEAVRQCQDLRDELSNYKGELEILSHKLEESLNAGLLKDAAVQEKNQHLQGKDQRLQEVTHQYQNLSNELKHYNKELEILSSMLKESHDAGLLKDAAIQGKDQRLQEVTHQYQNLRDDLGNYKGELEIISHKLKESLDFNLQKDAAVQEKDRQLQEAARQCQELSNYKGELEILSLKLEESLDAGLLKDAVAQEKDRQFQEAVRQCQDLRDELSNYKGELEILSHKLEESLNAGLLKDAAVQEKNQHLQGKDQRLQEVARQCQDLSEELSSYKEEVGIISHKLKESLDVNLEKDNLLQERTKQLEDIIVKLNKSEKELGDIYNSDGYKFILEPLWKIIWHSRLALKSFINKTKDILWMFFIGVLSPVVIIQFALFFCEDTAGILFGHIMAFFRKKREVIPFEELTVSVVIPCWNGIELLNKCLSSLYEIEEFKNGKYEILVIDDASKYNIAECLRNDFPKVRVLRNIFNNGFGRSCNRGVNSAKGELIVLLNNDIMVSRDFLAPLKAHFQDKNVFVVAPKLYCWDMKTFNYGMHMGRFENGYLNLWNEAETGNGDKISQSAPTVFAIGAAMVFRKKDFLWLGGFDDIYRPNCWEDIDISYRAQKRGLKVLYEPKSLVYHKAGATLNYVRHKEIKNELLFMWKNITDIRMLFSHFNQLPKLFYYGRHSGRWTFLRGYLWASTHLIPALINRFKERRYLKASDSKILNRCMLYYNNFKRNNFTHSTKKTILIITSFMIYPPTSGGKLRIYNICKRLSKEYNLILLSLIHNQDEEKYSLFLKQIFKEVHLIHPKTKSNEFLFPDRYKYSFSGLLIDKLIEIQDKKAIDIAHIESNELLYLTKYIKYIPIVYTEHDISILSPDKSYYSKRQNSPIMGIIDYFKIVRYHKSVYEKIDKVVVLSKEDIKLIKAFSPACDFSFIPTGVDLAHFTFREKYNEVNKSLIFVGHYPHYPNEEAAVYFVRHIYAPIKKQFPGVRLKLVGSDPTEAILKLSQVDGVDVIGTVDDVNPYLQQASVFVNAFQRSAGIKGKVLEAMATGTPVVCTSRGAYGIDAVSGKDIFIADKPKDFARRVIELLGNRELYNKIAYNARNLAEERYDWDKIARKLGKTYRDITGDVQYADKHEYLSCLKDEDIHNDKQFDTSKQETREIGIIEKSLDVPSRNNNIEVSDIIEKVNKVVDFSLECLSKDVKLQVNSDPEELHIELTHLCNSKCVMCDIWDYHPRNNKSVKDELSLKEIKDFIEKSKRLRNIKTVVLSGGEPFLKPELVEICSFIGEAFPRSSVGILTNGLDTDEILEGVKAISESSRVSSLWIGSSLDGVGESYDRIRGTNGGFRRFAKTIECLKRQFPKLNLSITFVLTPFNADQLVPSWEFARDNGLDFFAQFVVPKKARSVDVFAWDGIDFCQIENDIALIIKEIIERTQSLKSFYDSLNVLSDKISLITKIYYWSRLVNFQKTSRGFMGKCDAGYKFAMFDPYGNMFFCPLQKDKIAGNVRNKDFDTLWVSGEARDIRRNIEMNNCSCWLVCTIFPAVGRALTLYGDRSAVALRQDSKPEAIKIRPHAEIGNITISPPESDNLKPNSELNNLEFENKKCILGSTPQGITLGTNSECNAKCVFCLEGKYRSFSLDLYRNYFEPRLEYMLNRADYLSFCGMGEVLLIPEIENFLEYLNKKYSSKNKILTTNGLALNNKNIAQRILRNKYSLQISLHASSSALHEHITGIKGGFEEITRNIKELAAKRKDKQSPYITLVFVINTLNIEDLPAFVELAAALGVDCIQCNYLTIFKESHLKLSCFFKQELTNKMFELAEQKAGELNVILNLPPKFSARRYPGSKCGDPWKHLYIDTEGAVLPCCYSGEHYGEIKKEDISSIWNNNKFKRLRTDLASESPLQMCKYCVNAKQENVNYLSAHVSFRPEVQKIILGP